VLVLTESLLVVGKALRPALSGQRSWGLSQLNNSFLPILLPSDFFGYGSGRLDDNFLLCLFVLDKSRFLVVHLGT